MKLKGEAHKQALSLLFHESGIPHIMVVDGCKEQMMGDFRKEVRQAAWYLKQMEPYTPWSNAAEGSIRELKHGTGQHMLNNCAELQALIRSHTALNISPLNNEVPETNVTSQTADILDIAKFEWFNWVYFRHSAVSFPENKEVLGRYLGPSKDVGPAMAAKILR
jgi:hypothetical protein